MRIRVCHVLVVAALLGGIIAQAEAAGVSVQPERLAAAGKLVPVGDLNSAPVIDGDLRDWGDLRSGGLLLSQRTDHCYGSYEAGEHPDAALAKAAIDPQALYVAIRVVDASRCNPRADGVLWQGDCVEIYLDLRPVSGEGALLGTPAYTPGVWQLQLSPPTDDGKPFAWQVGNTGGGKLGAVEAAGRRTADGYELELRLPLSSLPGVSAARLQQPFGFALQILDLDEAGVAGGSRSCTGYSSTGATGFSEDASLFGCTTSGSTRAGRAGLLRLERAFVAGTRPQWQVSSVLAATLEQPRPQSLALSYRHRACAAERKLNAAGAAVAQRAAGPLQVDEWPSLGVWLCSRSLSFAGMPAGRYYLDVSAEGAGLPRLRGQARLYVRYRGAKPELALPPVDGEEVARGCYGPFLSDYYPLRGRDTRGWSWSWAPAAVAFDVSAQAEAAERAGRKWTSPWQLRLRLLSAGERREVWSEALPLQEKTEFTVPTGALPPGGYLLRTSLQTPRGEVPTAYTAYSRGNSLACEPEVALKVLAAAPAPISGSVRDAAGLGRRARCLGNPALRQFPKLDRRDAQARSVHDLQLFGDRVYVGVGDWDENRGPIDIISFAPPAAGAECGFDKEFTVDDESVDRFRVSGDALYVPGIDARESWDFGNYYTKQAGQWTKHRTLPNAVHVLDVAEGGASLYVATGTELGAACFGSSDGGRTWRAWRPNPWDGRVWQLCSLPQGLLVLTDNPRRGGYLLAEGRLQPLTVPLGTGGLISHCEPFAGGCVYSEGFMTPTAGPLHYLSDLQAGGQPITCLRNRGLTDLLVRDGFCYVLGARAEAKGWRATVYRSQDLHSWERVAEALVPALPSALEVAQGRYYLGLSNHDPWKSADAASGEIWEVRE